MPALSRKRIIFTNVQSKLTCWYDAYVGGVLSLRALVPDTCYLQQHCS